MKIFKCLLVALGVGAIFAGLQYFLLIPVSIHSFGFIAFIAMFIGIVGGIMYMMAAYEDESVKLPIITTASGIGIFAIACIIGLIGSPLFQANNYKEIITISEGNFAEDIPSPLDTEVMDVQTAINIGSRTMGEIDNVSQYTISNEYNMIVYKGKTYRVSPLEYASGVKALGNEGITGYVLVDCATQDANLIKLDDKIMYSPSAVFGHNLKRHVRFSYPSKLLGKEQFEIDEDGKPYYIIPTYKTTIGLFSGTVLDTILVVNASNGNIVEYTLDTLPEWVDHADSVSHMMQNTEYVYQYVNGFFNTMFKNKDVKTLSYKYSDSNFAGYSSIRTKDGIEYFTGVTSINNDESNLGFVFLNPRTGKTTFYNVIGAEESSAQSSAEALVQNYGYTASYPFIVNVDGTETYLIALKDKTGTNKAYSFVNGKNYTIAAYGQNKEEALAKYKKLLKNKDNNNEAIADETITAKIVQVYSGVENGTTYFYYKLEGYNELFVSPITVNRNQVLLKAGDTIKVNSELIDGYNQISSIEF